MVSKSEINWRNESEEAFYKKKYVYLVKKVSTVKENFDVFYSEKRRRYFISIFN